VFIASREKHLKRPTNIWQMSDGELCFIALLSLILAPQELGADFFFVEEPENYLHPRLLEILTGLLRQAQLELGQHGSGQVLTTTHSPHLIDKFKVEDLIVMQRREGHSTCLRPKDNADLRELVESEALGLGDLYYSGALTRA